jgi:hypothetical protein
VAAPTPRAQYHPTSRRSGTFLFSGIAAPEAQSHIIAVGNALCGQHDTTDGRRMLALYSYLESRGVKLTIRRGLLRFSCMPTTLKMMSIKSSN